MSSLRCALLALVLVSSAQARAEPIVLTFDGVPYVDSDGTTNQFYPGWYFLSINAGSGVISTEAGDWGWIYRTTPTGPGEPRPPEPWSPDWVGHPFDFIGMDVRRYLTTGGLTVTGYRNNELVATATAQFGDESFTWHEFDLRNIDTLRFTETGKEPSSFANGGYAFDNFTYVPEPSVMAFLACLGTIAAVRAVLRQGIVHPPSASTISGTLTWRAELVGRFAGDKPLVPWTWRVSWPSGRTPHTGRMRAG